MLKKLAVLVILAGSFLFTGISHADLLFSDEFNADVLNPKWQVKKVAGVDLLLTKQPGKLYIVNSGPETSIENGDAANLSIDVPNGDFNIETQITYISQLDYQVSGPALFVSFDNHDTIAWSYPGRTTGSYKHIFSNTQTGTSEESDAKKPPLYIRIRRISDNYIFEFRSDSNTAWEGIKQMVVKGTPIKAGLMFPIKKSTFGGLFPDDGNYEAALGYFHLEDGIADRSAKNNSNTKSAYLGFQVSNIKDRGAAFGFSSATKGVLVEEVTLNAPGDKAGLRPGDVVERVDQVAVNNTKQFFDALQGILSKEEGKNKSVSLYVNSKGFSRYVMVNVNTE